MRLAAFQGSLKEESIELCVLLNTDPNVFYFAGVEVEKCVLIIPDRGKPSLVVSELEAERARKSGIRNVESFRSGVERNSIIAAYLKGKSVVAVNKAHVSVSNLEFLQAFNRSAVFADASGLIDGLAAANQDRRGNRNYKGCVQAYGQNHAGLHRKL
ncbi:aminopeptidase P family N-terminal domain-containing protein [Candidatus Woesearchaeota archaeon]|nr:aminopeptidase P family N-terminal domain-containing protein [Candidatus Woesearchaeota archaeon]